MAFASHFIYRHYVIITDFILWLVIVNWTIFFETELPHTHNFTIIWSISWMHGTTEHILCYLKKEKKRNKYWINKKYSLRKGYHKWYQCWPFSCRSKWKFNTFRWKYILLGNKWCSWWKHSFQSYLYFVWNWYEIL